MKKEFCSISKFLHTAHFLLVGLLFVGIYCVFGGSIALATPSAPTAAEKEAFMREMKAKRGKADTGAAKLNLLGNIPKMDISEQAAAEELLEKRVNKARVAFEKNQAKLRIARDIATSTVAQLQLEGTDVVALREELRVFEEKMDEIDGFYKNYLNDMVLFGNEKGPDPGEIEAISQLARTKKEELLDFYKTSFRGSLEEALARNQQEKAQISN